MSNVVQPRWKRRADEIADAIGDELSVTVLAPVEIGNDVRIHSDSITALSNSISASLPTAAQIAAAIWSQSNRSVTTDALKASDLNIDVTRKLRVISEGFIGVDITHVDGDPIASGAAVPILTVGNDTVAITGSVSTDIGNITVPVSVGNVTVPVANTNNVTVPVNVGTAAVPIKATVSGIPQNSVGNNVLVPVNPTHSVTVPVSVGNVTVPLTNPNNVTVPVANTTNVTVPVSVGAATVPAYVPAGLSVPTSVSNSLSVPVVNSNNITIPVSASGTLDVKIVGDETHGIIMTKTYSTNGYPDVPGPTPTGDYLGFGYGLGVGLNLTQHRGVNGLGESFPTSGWIIMVNGTEVPNQDITTDFRGDIPVPLFSTSISTINQLNARAASYPRFIQIDSQATVDKYHGRKVTLSSVANVWIVEPSEDPRLRNFGTIHWAAGPDDQVSEWDVIIDTGESTGYTQYIRDHDGGLLTTSERTTHSGARVHRHAGVGVSPNVWNLINYPAA
jgi:hypothetical protein